MNDLVAIGSSFALLAKMGIIIFLIVYIIFSFAVSKQVKIMTDTLEVGFESQIKVIALIHIALSVAVLVVAIIIL
jgi:hypothetical protein